MIIVIDNPKFYGNVVGLVKFCRCCQQHKSKWSNNEYNFVCLFVCLLFLYKCILCIEKILYKYQWIVKDYIFFDKKDMLRASGKLNIFKLDPEIQEKIKKIAQKYISKKKD